MGVLDSYNRTARLQPAFLIAFPIALAALVAAVTVPEWWQRVSALVVASGVFVLAEHLVRDLGDSQQQKLWQQWGGAPTTQLLRWRQASNRVLHQQRHAAVAATTGVPLPSEADEAADPEAADACYEAASAILRERTRGEAFGLLLEENAGYGFRRNLYGCRAWGIASAAVGLVASLSAALIGHTTSSKIPVVPSIAVAAISACWIIGWFRVVTPAWVKKAGDRYAERLISAASAPPS